MSSLLSKTPWGKKDEAQQPHEDEQSLTTLLQTHEDRTALLLLVADCSESMRKGIEATFDPSDTGRPPPLPVRPSRPPTPSQKTEAASEPTPPDDQISPDDKAKHEAAVKEAEDEEKREKKEADRRERARKEHDGRVKELNSQKMQDLKKAAQDYFRGWQDRIIERVGEAVNHTGEATEQKAETRSRPAESPMKKQVVDEAARDEPANAALAELYPPQKTSLSELEEPQRVLILHSLLLLFLSLEHYHADSRILLLHIASSLHLPVTYLTMDESKVAQGLLEAAKAQMNADEETQQKAHDNKVARRWKVGLGTVAGATLIGISGGLLAPVLAAGLGTVFGGLGLGATATATYLGAIAGSAPLVGALFGAYGGRMAGQLVDNYAKEVSDFAFIPVRKPSAFSSAEASRRLRVAIGVSGWLTEPADVVKPWHVIGKDGIEAFALRWELEALMNLGNSMTTYIKSAAWGFAKSEIIKHTVFAALSAALWPLGIVKAARVIDNPFSVARSRAEKAGRVLADALINKVQGERPVTLVGYSLGGRLIYACLEELARRNAFGLVESVVLAGAPVPADSLLWRRMRSVVAGRVVNIYSTNDYLLGFLYRSSSLQYGIAGLQAVESVPGVENVDVTDLVDGHTKYRYLTGKILKKIGFEDIDGAAVVQDEKKLLQEEAKDEAEQQRKEQEAAASGKDPEAQAEEMEKEVEKKNSASYKDWMTEKMAAMKVKVGGGGGSSSSKATSGDEAKDSKGGKPESQMTEEEKFKAAQEGDEFNTDVSVGKEKEKGGVETGKPASNVGGTLGGFASAV